MERLKQLKMLLGIEDAAKDELLSFELELVERQVLDYCDIEELPDTLQGTVIRMAADLFRLEGYGSEQKPAAVQSVSRGDVQVSYGTEGGNYNEMTGAGGASFLNNYKMALNRYRKLRW